MVKKTKFTAQLRRRLKASVRKTGYLDVPDFDLDLTKPSSSDSIKDSDLSWEDCLDDDEAEGEATPAKAEPNNRKKGIDKGKGRRKRRFNGKGAKADEDQASAVARPTNLPECQTEEDILGLRDDQHDEFVSKALRAIDTKSKRKALGSLYDDCVLTITGGGTDQPTMINHRALTDAYEHTGRAINAMLKANPNLQVVSAAIVSEDGVASTDKAVMGIDNEITKGRKFAKDITDHFIGVVEPALFNSHISRKPMPSSPTHLSRSSESSWR